MAIDQARLQVKRDNAIKVLNVLIGFLLSHDLAIWSPTFRAMTEALDQGNDRLAIQLDKSVPRGGMGSMGDVDVPSLPGELDAELRFRQLNGRVVKVIANLRLYLDFAIDRPLVEV